MEHLTRDELLRVLAEARKHRERDWVMILVAYWHGLRASEVVALTAANFAGGFLTVQRLKGSKKTTQPLMESDEKLLNERAAVESWLAQVASDASDRSSGNHRQDARVFPVSRSQFWRAMQLYCRRARIPPHMAHPHVLKHSIGMHLMAEAKIHEVRQYLGHKSISSTGAYLEVDDEEASRAAAKLASQPMETSDRQELIHKLRAQLRELERDELKKGRKKG